MIRPASFLPLLSDFKSWFLKNRLGFFSGLFSFVVIITFIDITLSRNAAVRNLKAELAQLTAVLNQTGLDIAWDRLEFNNIFFYPLVEAENLRLYNLRGTHLWSYGIQKISARPNLFNARHVNFVISGDMHLQYDSLSRAVQAQTAGWQLEFSKDGQFEELELQFDDTDIKDTAKIKTVIAAVRRLHNVTRGPVLLPSLEGHLEISDTTLNGLLDYPLGAEIERIYLKANLMGELPLKDTIILDGEKWLHNGGFIEIPSLNVSWKPLLMVGNGSISFDENFSPVITIQTSSTAFLNLLDDLQKNEFLDRKGVFVANILLNAKAFKLHEDDKYLTVTTPISYRDKTLAIENVTVKTFQTGSAQ